jgi:hypothetical protein
VIERALAEEVAGGEAGVPGADDDDGDAFYGEALRERPRR